MAAPSRAATTPIPLETGTILEAGLLLLETGIGEVEVEVVKLGRLVRGLLETSGTTGGETMSIAQDEKVKRARALGTHPNPRSFSADDNK
jgi:hypothetical protein